MSPPLKPANIFFIRHKQFIRNLRFCGTYPANVEVIASTIMKVFPANMFLFHALLAGKSANANEYLSATNGVHPEFVFSVSGCVKSKLFGLETGNSGKLVGITMTVAITGNLRPRAQSPKVPKVVSSLSTL